MKCVAGTIDGHGARMYIGVGFVPDEVLLKVQEGRYEDGVWIRNATEIVTTQYGFSRVSASFAVLTATTGFLPYYGGDTIVTASEVYKMRDQDADKKGNITTWETTTASTFKGKFDVVYTSTLTNPIAAGSVMILDGREYKITAFTADGEDDDDVTLDRTPPTVTGVIGSITGAYSFIATPVGYTMPAGFSIGTGLCNADGDYIWFKAIKY